MVLALSVMGMGQPTPAEKFEMMGRKKFNSWRTGRFRSTPENSFRWRRTGV